MYFLVRTNNPRPTFHLDMTEAQRATMAAHVAYWTAKAHEGISVVFGPVADPEGVYGIGVFEVADEAEMRGLLGEDPADGLLTYRLTPMAGAVVGPWCGLRAGVDRTGVPPPSRRQDARAGDAAARRGHSDMIDEIAARIACPRRN